MDKLICHSRVNELLRSLPDVLSFEFRRIIASFERRDLADIKYLRSVTHIVPGAVEARLQISDDDCLAIFYLKVGVKPVAFYAFKTKLLDLEIPESLIDDAQNCHVEILDELEIDSYLIPEG